MAGSAQARVRIPGGRARRQVWGRFLVAACLGVAGALVLAPELFGLAQRTPFAEAVAFRPAAAVALVVLALLALLVRRRWWPVTLALLLVAVPGLCVVAPRAIVGQTPGPGAPLTILSFNVYDGHADVAALAQAIHGARPDVIVLPEAGERYRLLLMPRVADLGYRSWTTVPSDSPDVDGIVVLAAPRLGDIAVAPLPFHTLFRWMELSGGALGAVRVVAVHAAAPVPGLTREWVSELAMLRRWCGPGRGPNIVIGDFNATLDHAVLRSGSAGCTDAAADRGNGLVATWPSRWPRWFGAQIDHVFVNGGPRPASLAVLDLRGSDHRALLTSVVLPR